VNLLGLDTSMAGTSVCALRADGEAFEVESPPGEGPAHASELLPAVAEALERAGLDWPQLDAIAVGVGPGGFTGLRIGVATARALAAASGCELRPVSSLRALAAGIAADAREDPERPAGGAPAAGAPLLPLIDARRGQLFGALYEGDPPEELWAPFAARPEEVVERVRAAGVSPLAAGDGALPFGGMLETAGIRVLPDAASAHVVRALHVCRLAATAPAAPPQMVLPDYIRAPDARPRGG
jgi:tRNA threonylcarbamoyladenosine biosynthesis protein TsaB